MRQTNQTKIVMWIMIILLLAGSVSALGVAPAVQVIDYETGVRTMSFRIINKERVDMKVALYPTGELGDYITIEDELIDISSEDKEKTVYYKINLPKDLEPGIKDAGVIVVELPQKFARTEDNLIVTDDTSVLFEKKDKDTLVSATTAIIAKLQVDVPYPGVYAEATLYVSESDVDEKTTFTISLFNRGTEKIEPSATIIIKGPTNEEIARIDTGSTSIEAGKEGKLVGNWLANVEAGTYVAEAIVNYNGKLVKPTKNFVVGNKGIRIGDLIVNNFRLGGIAKLDVDIISEWNQKIEDVYADMQIMDQKGNTVSDVKTISMSIEPFSEETISGYWDTQGVNIGDYDVNIVLHYGGKTTAKLFETVVGVDSIMSKDTSSLSGEVIGAEESPSDFKMSFLIMIVLILIGVNVGIFVYFKKFVKKGKKDKNSKK
ncbi:MAG: hypothetical protein ABIE94_03890 [archaeon]